MGAVETQRTLVKSVPEVWAELSEDGVLARMFRGRFGEIRLTHLTPESSIEWEGELAAGLVELEPSVFGTRVRLSAVIAEAPPPPSPPAVAVAAPPRIGLLARLFGRRPPPRPQAPPPLVQAPAPHVDPQQARDALTAILEEIGTARHRPFSRDAGASARIT
jgi:hypothetical protein